MLGKVEQVIKVLEVRGYRCRKIWNLVYLLMLLVVKMD